MKNPVITRFAPSPTGLLHCGNYRTALFAYLFARKNNGTFILRIEDTDKVRSKKEFEDNIIESLKWLGLDYDAFYRQSDRTAIHATHIQKLIDSGHAYISKETPKEPGDRAEVIRFKNPNKKVKWVDIIRGEIEFDTTELADFVIARSMTEPVFHLVVVVDDNDMGVTHIIRGEDHISNTSRHILIYEALGFKIPEFAHLPLLLSPDRTKLSKRKGALPVSAYKDMGFVPNAIVNFLALLGWNPGGEQEIFNIAELIEKFDLSKVQKSGAIFNEEKLRWMNKQYLSKTSDEEFLALAKSYIPKDIMTNPALPKMISLMREKISTLGEIPALFTPEGELSFVSMHSISDKPAGELMYKKESLMWKGDTDISKTKEHLKNVIDLVKQIDDGRAGESFSLATIKSAIWTYVEANGKGNVLWPMRYALSGKDRSPDPFIIAEIIGKDETIARLTQAYNAL